MECKCQIKREEGKIKQMTRQRVIEFPSKTLPDIFKQTRIRRETVKIQSGKKSRRERGFGSLEHLVKVRDGL